MQIDFSTLGKELSAAGLTGKAVSDYSKEEVATLVRAVYAACPPTPFVEELRAIMIKLGVSTETFYKFFGPDEPPF